MLLESPQDLDALKKKIDSLKEASAPSSSKVPNKTPLGKIGRIASDFVSGVIVGVGVGLTFDHFLSTKPWGLIVFFLLGSAAGFRNIMRFFDAEKTDQQ